MHIFPSVDLSSFIKYFSWYTYGLRSEVLEESTILFERYMSQEKEIALNFTFWKLNMVEA